MSQPSVALAFEAGESPEPFAQILDTLKGSGVKVTVFLDGLWAELNPDLVRRVAAEGHEFGNHGYAHPDWADLSDDEIREDLKQVEEIVEGLTDKSPKPWALPPLLGFDDRVDGVLRDAGYRAINRYPIDGNSYADGTPDGMRKRALSEATDCAVIIIHTGRDASAESIPGILNDLTAEGYKVGRISDLDSVPSYPPVTPPHG